MTVLADRVGETSVSVGNGAAWVLAGAKQGYQTFAAGIGYGVTTYYAIVHRTSGQWEVGIGSVAAGPDTLTRATVLSGSAGAGVRVNFVAGTTDVFVGLPAGKTAYVDPASGFFVIGAPTTVVQALTATGTVAAPAVVITSATNAAQLILDPTAGGAGDNSQILVKRNGVIKWQIGNNVSLGGDVFEIYSTVAGGYAIQVNPATKAVTFSATLSAPAVTLLGNAHSDFTVSGANERVAQFTSTNAANPYGIIVTYSGSAPNGTINEFLYCQDSGTLRASIRSNGGIANFSANNVNLSDERLKTEIRDLESQWARHKRIRVVRGRFIDQTHDDDNYMGIAQNIESIYPELVDELTLRPETDESAAETAKAIYETDLNWITRDVVQECQRRIESIEKQLAA